MKSNESSPSIRRALVTGASEGIGRSFARKLAERGYAVTLVARNTERLRSLQTELKGKDHRILTADLSRPEGLASVVAEVNGPNHYSLLVNNAGFGQLGDFSESVLTGVREMIFLNVTTLVELSHAFLVRAKRGDGIIQISSTLSYLPMPRQAVYSATKAFVTSFSESLWYQCQKKGIAVLNVCPGSTATLFPARSGGDPKKIPAWATQTPDQVAETSLQTFERKLGPTVVTGWKNRVALFFMRFVTRKQLLKIMGGIRQ